MSKTQKSVSEAVSEIALPIAKSLGLELWDVKFLKEGPNWYLRIFIDKPEGVNLEDCENMSRKIDEPLEILDPIEQSYFLEVCSPGIERELSKDSHLEKFINHDINIKLFKSDNTKEKCVSGKLLSFDKENLIIDHDSQKIEIPRKNISKIKLKILEENRK